MRDSLEIISNEIKHLNEKVNHAYSTVANADLFVSYTAILFGFISLVGIIYQIKKAKELKDEVEKEIEKKNELSEKLELLSSKELELENKFNSLKGSIDQSQEFYRNILNSITVDVMKEIIYLMHSSEQYDNEIIELLLNRTYMRELMIRLHDNKSSLIQTLNELNYYTEKDYEYIPEFKDLIETFNYIKNNSNFSDYEKERIIHLKHIFENQLEDVRAASNIR